MNRRVVRVETVGSQPRLTRRITFVKTIRGQRERPILTTEPWAEVVITWSDGSATRATLPPWLAPPKIGTSHNALISNWRNEHRIGPTRPTGAHP